MKRILTVITLLLLTSCSNNDVRLTAVAKPGFENVKDVPIPESAKMDLKKSHTVGNENSWTGQVVYESSKDTAHIIDLYTSHMPQFGWTKTNDVRGEITSLTYTKDDRIANIQILMKSGLFARTEVHISVDRMHVDNVTKLEETTTEETVIKK